MNENTCNPVKSDSEAAAARPSPPQPPQPRRRRIAVFGGSFDPVHTGHIFVAGNVLRLGYADEVLFVPAKVPPHKLDRIPSPAKHRMAMLHTVIESYPQFSLSDIELQRDAGPSYTIDTLETLQRIYNDAEIIFIMGLDSLAELHTWHRAGELVNRNNFLIFTRPGVELPARSLLARHFGPRNGKKLADSIIPIASLPVSSSIVRDAAVEGHCLAGLVTPDVERYIQKTQLYRLRLSQKATEPEQ